MYFEVYDVMKHVANISLIRNDVKIKMASIVKGNMHEFA